MTVRRALLIVAVNIAVLGVVAEVAGLVVFYSQHGWLFYLDPYRPAYPRIAETAQGGLSPMALHPYFGPTHRPGVPFDIPEALRPGAGAPVKTNNLGFAAPFDYPVAKRDANQVFVGIFGGSVAGWFCQVGAGRMVEALHARPAFASREIVPLCVSHEGYKQPQQLLLLSYLLSRGQVFDVVLDIDGFNEVALGRLNDERGWDTAMPSVMHLGPLIEAVDASTLTPQKLEALATIQREKEQLNRISARLTSTRLASVFVVLERYRVIVERRYRAAQAAFGALPAAKGDTSMVRAEPRPADGGPPLYERIAHDWMAASDLMRTMATANGAVYVHVLQPNQYATTRSFTPEEAAVALNAGSPFKAGAEQGYPALVRAMEARRTQAGASGEVDGTHLFDREPSKVYIDDCCHYTLRGYELLADAAASAVAAGWDAGAATRR
jgi:hypothetical protein